MDIHYILIGLHNDDYAKEITDRVKEQPHLGIFHLYSFLNHHEICKFYSIADIGVWTKPAISILEAMGTGLMILLEDKPSVNHLLDIGVTGLYYKKDHFDSSLRETCKQVVSINKEKRKLNREKIARLNSERFSYSVIAKKILDSIVK
jgi:glycosyltransferase involved in cell wall biosynthesis